MKKLLSIFAVIASISTITINVIACTNPKNNDEKNTLDMGILFSRPSNDKIKRQIVAKFKSKYNLNVEKIEIDEISDHGAKVVAFDFNTNNIVAFQIKWIIRSMVSTKYIDKVGRENETYEKDLFELDTKKITQIGYYKNNVGEIQVVRMPKIVEEVPSVLPQEITSLEGVFGGKQVREFEWEGIINKKVKGIEDWDTSNISNLSYVFCNASNFDQDISSWNTSNVIDMKFMFNEASSFNKNISNWKTDNVVNIEGIFSGATLFSQDLSFWNVSNVINQKYWNANSGIASDKSKWPSKFK